MPLPDNEVERVLVVTAHPDDVDFGAAGTIALWTKAGVEVTYCIVTDGQAGGFDLAVPRTKMPAIRRAEQIAAASEVGVTDVRFLGHEDGEVTASLALRRDISRVIREVRPQRVVTQSPERNWSRIQASHPDHLATGEAAMCAVYPDARNPFAHPDLLADDGLEAWTVLEVWLMASPEPDHFVDITDVVPAKLAALRAHVSQMPPDFDVEARVRERLAHWATLAKLPESRLAEAFQVVSTV